jgi:hypothetical protein
MPAFARLQAHMTVAGAWFCVPERVAQVALHYAPEVPRRVILCESPLLDVTVRALFRSTSVPTRWPVHPAHEGSCSQPSSCRIDVDGWIEPDELRDIPVHELDQPDAYSCLEPDEDLVEQVMAVRPKRRKR